MSLPGRVQVRYVGEKPVMLFERWIEPGEVREVNVKQLALIERKFPGKFDTLGVTEAVRGDELEAEMGAEMGAELVLGGPGGPEEGSDGDSAGDVGKPARKRRARARRGA